MIPAVYGNDIARKDIGFEVVSSRPRVARANFDSVYKKIEFIVASDEHVELSGGLGSSCRCLSVSSSLRNDSGLGSSSGCSSSSRLECGSLGVGSGLGVSLSLGLRFSSSLGLRISLGLGFGFSSSLGLRISVGLSFGFSSSLGSICRCFGDGVRVCGAVRRMVAAEHSVVVVVVTGPKPLRISWYVRAGSASNTPPDVASIVSTVADGSGPGRIIKGIGVPVCRR